MQKDNVNVNPSNVLILSECVQMANKSWPIVTVHLFTVLMFLYVFSLYVLIVNCFTKKKKKRKER